MTRIELVLTIFCVVLLVLFLAVFLVIIVTAALRVSEIHAKIFPPTVNRSTNTMTAQELIDLLSRDPQAKVMIQVEDKKPSPLLTSQISLNNEAHAWIIWEPEPCR